MVLEMTQEEPIWDCESMGEHYEIVSGCCGAGEHSDVVSMCGACNEFTGWYCALCEQDVDSIVWE